MTNPRVSRTGLAVAIFSGLAMASPAVPRTAPNFISDFKQGTAGWTVVRIDKKVPATQFRAVVIDGIHSIEARADKSMALLTKMVSVDLARTPVLCWRWRVSGALKTADISRKTGDDQAARLYIGLKLPAASLSLGTRAKLALARARGGDTVPDGTLNYVWDNRFPVGTIRPNVYTSQARVVVQETGNANAGRWVSERRDIAADIISQFKTQSGRVVSIALSSDTDNSGESVTAAFAEIHMVGRDEACRFS